ncbi:hypothetical protein [Parapedobacter tibetensis]|uniref:hypothetical protein n=1 Tax=Parapedobacter tibetensis TaxID=2972951 RepID=UPI00214D344B|nr:hypothetical protein [Parapedobacter tibetensis]
MLNVALACCILTFSFTGSFAQQETQDTSSYESQRQKVNELLVQRSARFGQFDESLKQRTGIFGLKTKKDMQASIDILKQIVLTDNDIFRETKLLLDYKDFEKSQIVEQASEFDGRINGYIKTISKLQREQEQRRQEIQSLQNTNRIYSGLLILALFGFVIAVVLFAIQRQKLTKV